MEGSSDRSPYYGSIQPFHVEAGGREGGGGGDVDGHWGGELNSYDALVNRSMMNDEDTEEAEYSSHYTRRGQYAKTHNPTRSRRWSVMEKLEQRHYCRIRSCADCGRILNCKCLLATCMLGIFVIMAVTFAHVLFFATEVGSVRFDYIVIGAGPAGSLLANRLVGGGATVLLLESGNYTQYEVLGRDYFAGPVSRFDIPLLWPVASQFLDFRWKTEGRSGSKSDSNGTRDDHSDDESAIIQAKGVGGNGVFSSMIYMRALPGDIKRWASSTWTWERMLSLYRSLEHFDDRNEHIRQSPSMGTRALSEAEHDVEPIIPDYHAPDGADDVHGKCDDGASTGIDIGTGVDCSRIVTASPSFVDLLSTMFLAAAEATGIGKSSDFNDHKKPRVGAGMYHFNVADGVRDSAARKFLRPILGEPGLVLEVEASVTQILMNADVSLNATYPAMAGDPAAYRAIGVEFVQNGELKRAFLRNAMIPEKLQAQFDTTSRGVIITAGALMTPKVLMKSGIGPEDKLSQAGVEAKVISRGVGKDLRDHPTLALVMEVDEHLAATLPSSYDFLSALPQYVDAVSQARAQGNTVGPGDASGATGARIRGDVGAEITMNGGTASDFGILGSPGIAAGAFLRSPISQAGAWAGNAGSTHSEKEGQDGEPDIQLTVYPFVPDGFSHLVKTSFSTGAHSDTRRRHNPATAHRASHMTITVSLLRPDASMEVYLKESESSSPTSTPRLPSIAPTLPAEREGAGAFHSEGSESGDGSGPNLNLGAALSQADVTRLHWGLQQARKILKATPFANHSMEEVSPGGEIDSADALRAWLLSDSKHFSTANNWCGSAHFGPPSDPFSVLDEDLRVKGVQDLRVADSSALPALPSGNIQATVLALAESVARDILASGQPSENPGRGNKGKRGIA